MVKRFAALAFGLSSLFILGKAYKQTLPMEWFSPSFFPECMGAQGDNFLFNGDFGAGEDNIFQEDPGLSPSYPYSFSGPPDLGTYTLTNNTTPWTGDVADTWIDIEDNSPDPNGYMMVVDAAIEPGIFYEITIDVCPNTNYEFSADIINIVDPNVSLLLEPNVDFLIEGNAVLNTGNIPQDATWYNFGFLYATLADQFTLTLALRNNASGDAGNDLAIDNISFRACGPEVNANLANTDPICPGDSLEVNLTIGPGYPNPFIQWQVLSPGVSGWQNIGDITDQLNVSISPIPADAVLRALVAQSPDELLNNPLCAVISNELAPLF